MKSSLKPIIRFVSISYLFILAVLWLAPYWPKSFWWLANLWQFIPLWIFLPPLILLFLFSLLFKERISLSVHVLSFLVVVFGIMGFHTSFFKIKPKSNPTYSVLRVMSVNMGRRMDLKALAQYIMKVEPDIIALQESHVRFQNFFKQVLPANEWSFAFDGRLGLASRFEIKSMELQDRRQLKGWGAIVAKYQLQGTQGPFSVFNLHLESPREGIEAMMAKKLGGITKMKQVTKLQEIESQIASNWAGVHRSVLVTGDFNMVQSNPIYQKYWSKWTNAFAKVGWGFGSTKYTRWHGTRIDHILYDPNWYALDAQIGPDMGGDHRPLVVDLTFIGAD